MVRPVEDDVLARVEGEAQAQMASQGSQLGQLLPAFSHLTMELGMVRMGRTRRQTGSHPVESDVLLVQVDEQIAQLGPFRWRVPSDLRPGCPRT